MKPKVIDVRIPRNHFQSRFFCIRPHSENGCKLMFNPENFYAHFIPMKKMHSVSVNADAKMRACACLCMCGAHLWAVIIVFSKHKQNKQHVIQLLTVVSVDWNLNKVLFHCRSDGAHLSSDLLESKAESQIIFFGLYDRLALFSIPFSPNSIISNDWLVWRFFRSEKRTKREWERERKKQQPKNKTQNGSMDSVCCVIERKTDKNKPFTMHRQFWAHFFIVIY